MKFLMFMSLLISISALAQTQVDPVITFTSDEHYAKCNSIAAYINSNEASNQNNQSVIAAKCEDDYLVIEVVGLKPARKEGYFVSTNLDCQDNNFVAKIINNLKSPKGVIAAQTKCWPNIGKSMLSISATRIRP